MTVCLQNSRKIPLKTGNMIAHNPGRPVAIAGLDRRNNLAMLQDSFS